MSTDEWFKNTVLHRRYFFIAFWNFLIQSSLLWTVKISGVIITSVLGIVFLPVSTAIVTQIYIGVLVICLCVIFFRTVKVRPDLPGHPLSFMYGLLKPNIWLQASLFTVLAALWSQCLLAFSANSTYSQFWQNSPTCPQESSGCCVSEKHFFVFLHGAFLGLGFHFAYQTRHFYCLKFHAVQQLKLPSAKASVKKQVNISIFVVLKNVRYFYVFYYLLGFIPKHVVSHTLGQRFCDDVPLTSLYGLFDLQLLYMVCIIGITVHASWMVALSLVKIFLTERFSFPIETSLQKEKAALLTNAISDSNSDLLQHLAFQNLANVAQYSSDSRKKIFSVSIPGGHPHMWNEISGRCLQVITSFQDSLSQAISTTTANSKPAQVSQVNISSYLEQTPQTNGTPYYPKTSTPLSPSLVQTPIGTAKLRSSFKARNIVDKEMGLKSNYNLDHKVPLVKMEKAFVVKGYVADKMNKVLENLMNKPVVKFLTMEPNERKLEKLMCRCQLVIWSVQALVFLVRASYTEDENGVVQWSLSKIVSSLLDLQMAVERCPKGMMRNNQSRETWFAPPRSFCLKLSLNAAINSGLYYITCTFRNHLKYIELSDEHRNRIERYLEMKE